MTRINIGVVGLALFVGCVGGVAAKNAISTAIAQNTVGRSYEYKMERVPISDSERRANEMGKAGWRVVLLDYGAGRIIFEREILPSTP
jgi:hypothetical protein